MPALNAAQPVTRHVSSDAADISAIITTVATAAGITTRDIRGEWKAPPLVDARHIAMWLVRRLIWVDTRAIGRAFGNRSHSTVMNGIARVDRRMAADPEFAERVVTLLDLSSAARTRRAAGRT